MRILLVEDSPSLQRTLTAGLSNTGYAVDQAFDGEQAIKFATHANYELIILDIMIPKIDGLAVLKKLRNSGNRTHVLILSAKDTTQNRIDGLDVGADDYLVKPFSFEELLARIRALIRRSNSEKQNINSTLRVSNLQIDTADRSLLVDNTKVALTPNEYKILELLARRPNHVFSHDQLIDRIYTSEQSVTRNTIEVHLSALRRKLKSAGATDVLKTRRGFGYFIESNKGK